MVFQGNLQAFKTVQENKKKSITELMSEQNRVLAEKNGAIINGLIECMLLCVKRGFASKAHKDSGVPTLSDSDSDGDNDVSDNTVNMGNFKEIVKFAAKQGNTALSNHLKNHKKNATYMSNTAQRDMLECILAEIQKLIIKEAQQQDSKFIFAISADEATDTSCTEQLAVVLRTVSPQGVVRERLLEFIGMESIAGTDVATAIVSCLNKHGLDVRDCRAQTYDGAGNMSGHLNGARAHIQQLEPLADYYHCASHKLNLALNATSKIMEYRVLMSHITKLGIFMKYSLKWQTVFQWTLIDAGVKVKKVRL